MPLSVLVPSLTSPPLFSLEELMEKPMAASPTPPPPVPFVPWVVGAPEYRAPLCADTRQLGCLEKWINKPPEHVAMRPEEGAGPHTEVGVDSNRTHPGLRPAWLPL